MDVVDSPYGLSSGDSLAGSLPMANEKPDRLPGCFYRTFLHRLALSGVGYQGQNHRSDGPQCTPDPGWDEIYGNFPVCCQWHRDEPGQDYRAIQWMQENVQGSPVILEAQAYEYYWGNRYTIYTGLPGVVGWNYHQRQQRAVLRNNAVQERVDEVNAFYLSLDEEFIKNYLDKYNVEYIIVGQQEQAFYPAETLVKFDSYDGMLWDVVYSEANTVIYKVR